MFVAVTGKEGATVLLKKDMIAKMSIAKNKELPQSEREVKVEFVNGDKGIYTIHRKKESVLVDSLTGYMYDRCSCSECSTESSTEGSKETVEA